MMPIFQSGCTNLFFNRLFYGVGSDDTKVACLFLTDLYIPDVGPMAGYVLQVIFPTLAYLFSVLIGVF